MQFLLSGLGAWFSIQEAVLSCSSCLSKNSSIIKNISFPTYIFSVSTVICSLLFFADIQYYYFQ